MSSTAEAPFSATTVTATSSSTSATVTLDKPLHELTEDDISQLTREDCRRYLKLKGMRRPSWNKSQAIQQVIMLKSLLEPAPDSGDCGRKLYISSRQQTLTTRVQKGTSADTEISLSAEESVPGHQNDTERADFLGDNDSAPSRIGGGTEVAKGQMTIFYCGKVNVYDDMPTDKAQALLQFAASPYQFPQEDQYDGNMLQAPSINVGRHVSPQFPDMLSPITQTAEGSASRKVSVQRYLEKRKDRFKSKRKTGAQTSDDYVNHQTVNHTHNLHEQSSRSATCSPPPLRPPKTPNRFS